MKKLKSIYKKHPFISYPITVLLVLLLLYSTLSVCISFKLNSVIKKAFNNEPYDEQLISIISESDYELLNPAQPQLEENSSVKIEHSNSLPLVLPFFTDAYFRYSYFAINEATNEDIYGGEGGATLELEYTPFSVKITNVEVEP